MHSFKLLAGERQFPFSEDSYLFRDALGGLQMVPGNHHGFDAGLLCCLDRRPRFRAGRIDHGDQAKKDELAFVPVGDLSKSAFLVGQAKDAVTFLRELANRAVDFITVPGGQVSDAVAVNPVCLPQHHVPRSLHEEQAFPINQVQSAHDFACGVKGEFAHAGIFF